jgi:hypothetical protein
MGEVRGYHGRPAPQGRGSRVRRNRLFGLGLDIVLTGLPTLVACQRRSATDLLEKGAYA